MRYAIVINYNSNKKICLVAVVDSTNTRNILGVFQVLKDQLINWCRSNNLTPYNFTVNPSDGSVKESAGVFTRFQDSYGVVLVRVLTHSKRVFGYRIITKSGAIQDVTLRDILSSGIKFQNAIIQGGVLKCYEGFPFQEIVMAKPAKPISKPSTIASEFTEAQVKEIEDAKKQGVSTKDLIENPKLSPKQMRVLWVSKKNGALAESYASPVYKAGVMKFYADRVYNEKSLNLCKPLLLHPELEVDQLEELYLCLLQRVPIDSLIGLTADEIRIERNKRCKVVRLGSDLIDNALRVANKLKQES